MNQNLTPAQRDQLNNRDADGKFAAYGRQRGDTDVNLDADPSSDGGIKADVLMLEADFDAEFGVLDSPTGDTSWDEEQAFGPGVDPNCRWSVTEIDRGAQVADPGDRADALYWLVTEKPHDTNTQSVLWYEPDTYEGDWDEDCGLPLAGGDVPRDSAGFDTAGWDVSGFNVFGFDREGYGRDGFNRAGVNRNGVGRDGSRSAGQTSGA